MKALSQGDKKFNPKNEKDRTMKTTSRNPNQVTRQGREALLVGLLLTPRSPARPG